MFLTSMVAPLIAHLIELCSATDNSWSTERILLLYFSALMGQIIAKKIVSLLTRSPILKSGIKKGNYDAVISMIYAMPAVVLCLLYDSIIGTIILIVMAVISSVILWIDRESIVVSLPECIGAAFLATVVVVFLQFFPTDMNDEKMVIVLGELLLVQAIVCLIFHFVEAGVISVFRRLKRR